MGTRPYLSEEAFRPTQSLWRVLGITHFDAGECGHHAMLCTQLQNASIAIMAFCVVVPSRQLCGMTARVVPPVDACYLEADLHCSACWLPLGPREEEGFY